MKYYIYNTQDKIVGTIDESILQDYKDRIKELEGQLKSRTKEVLFLGNERAYLKKENRKLKELLDNRDETSIFEKKFTNVKDVNKLHNSSIISNEPINTIKSNTLTVNVKATEIDEVKNIIASFIFMLEDSRINRDIRLQYLESCKELKEQYFVRIDK